MQVAQSYGPWREAGPMDEVFRRIWVENRWGDRDSRSGGGSNLEQTAAVRRQLNSLLTKLAPQSMLDLPCGDFYWMQHVSFPSSMRYRGADIVPALIEQNQRRHASTNVQFETLNLVTSPLPQVDLVFCRDCLVHLDYDAIEQAIQNLRRSKSTYLLTTHFQFPRINHDIQTGQWRPLDLTAKPFFFPKPLECIDEQCTENQGRYRDKSLGLWQIADLPQNLNR
jgi:SAM-dependent methyltransferase